MIPSYARMPVEFVRGEGARLWDVEGNEYLDFLCGISVTNLGHCHPRVVEAVREQVGRLMHVSNLFYTEPAMRLAERLSQSSLGGKVFFCNSGAEANEAAIKLARKARPAATSWSSTAPSTGAPTARCRRRHRSPSRRRSRRSCRASARSSPTPQALAARGRRAAPPRCCSSRSRARPGVHVLSEELLRAARAACDEHGAALIFDEIQCGMGRTGTLWAYEQTGVRPRRDHRRQGARRRPADRRAVTGERLADVLAPGDHGSTFAGGPVVARGGARGARGDRRPGAARRACASSASGSPAGLERLPHVRSVRGRGLMLACELDVPAPEVVRRALLEQRLVVNATGPTTCGCCRR